jgi:hypothetical protein
LTLPFGHPLPALCVKCGQDDALVPREHTFVRRPAWTYLLLFFGLVPRLLLIREVAKRGTVFVPLCRPCNSRWGTTVLAQRLAVYVPLATGLALMIAGAFTDKLELFGVALVVLFPGTIVAVVLVRLLLTRPRLLIATRIDEQAITLRGVSSIALDAIDPSGGSR